MSKTNLLLDAHLLRIACTTPTADSPIGVFDSGVGGLSVYRHLRQQLPYERYLYYADTKHVPYGSRTAEDISHLTLTGIDWLIRQGCKLVVVACNSGSAHALNQARLRYPTIPIVGLVPALKPALAYVQAKNAQLTQASANLSNHLGNHVAVLATMATLHGQPLNDVMVQFATPHAIKVSKWYEPALVPWVERGMPPTDATAERLRKMLMLFAKQGVQAIVLGCTHYPFFKEFLLNQMVVQGHDMALFDSGNAIARRVKQLLAEQGLLMSPKNMPQKNMPQKNTLAVSNQSSNLHSQPNPPKLQFFATAMTQGLSELVMKLCDEEVLVDAIDG